MKVASYKTAVAEEARLRANPDYDLFMHRIEQSYRKGFLDAFTFMSINPDRNVDDIIRKLVKWVNVDNPVPEEPPVGE
jgi:hypothetical protein